MSRINVQHIVMKTAKLTDSKLTYMKPNIDTEGNTNVSNKFNHINMHHSRMLAMVKVNIKTQYYGISVL